MECYGCLRKVHHQQLEWKVCADLMYASCGAGSFCFVGLALCIRYSVIRPHLHVLTTTDDSVLAGIVMSFATLINAFSFCLSVGAFMLQYRCQFGFLTCSQYLLWGWLPGCYLALHVECSSNAICPYTSFRVGQSLLGFGRLWTKLEHTGLLSVG